MDNRGGNSGAKSVESGAPCLPSVAPPVGAEAGGANSPPHDSGRRVSAEPQGGGSADGGASPPADSGVASSSSASAARGPPGGGVNVGTPSSLLSSVLKNMAPAGGGGVDDDSKGSPTASVNLKGVLTNTGSAQSGGVGRPGRATGSSLSGHGSPAVSMPPGSDGGELRASSASSSIAATICESMFAKAGEQSAYTIEQPASGGGSSSSKRGKDGGNAPRDRARILEAARSFVTTATNDMSRSGVSWARVFDEAALLQSAPPLRTAGVCFIFEIMHNTIGPDLFAPWVLDKAWVCGLTQLSMLYYTISPSGWNPALRRPTFPVDPSLEQDLENLGQPMPTNAWSLCPALIARLDQLASRNLAAPFPGAVPFLGASPERRAAASPMSSSGSLTSDSQSTETETELAILKLLGTVMNECPDALLLSIFATAAKYHASDPTRKFSVLLSYLLEDKIARRSFSKMQKLNVPLLKILHKKDQLTFRQLMFAVLKPIRDLTSCNSVAAQLVQLPEILSSLLPGCVNHIVFTAAHQAGGALSNWLETVIVHSSPDANPAADANNNGLPMFDPEAATAVALWLRAMLSLAAEQAAASTSPTTAKTFTASAFAKYIATLESEAHRARDIHNLVITPEFSVEMARVLHRGAEVFPGASNPVSLASWKLNLQASPGSPPGSIKRVPAAADHQSLDRPSLDKRNSGDLVTASRDPEVSSSLGGPGATPSSDLRVGGATDEAKGSGRGAPATGGGVVEDEEKSNEREARMLLGGMFKGSTSVSDMVAHMSRMAASPPDSVASGVLDAVVAMLTDEVKHLRQYPAEQLIKNAQLFGLCLRDEILSRRSDIVTTFIKAICVSLMQPKKFSLFGICAFEQFLDRFREFPLFAKALIDLHSPQLESIFPEYLDYAQQVYSLIPLHLRDSLRIEPELIQNIAFPQPPPLLLPSRQTELLKFSSRPQQQDPSSQSTVAAAAGPSQHQPPGAVLFDDPAIAGFATAAGGGQVNWRGGEVSLAAASTTSSAALGGARAQCPLPPTMNLEGFGLGTLETLLEDEEIISKFSIPPETFRTFTAQIFNSLDPDNVAAKAADISSMLRKEYIQWLCFYLVKARAAKEVNLHGTYNSFIDYLGVIEQVTTMTYDCILVLFKYVDAGKTAMSYRLYLKQLGTWLGSLTIARDRPILSKKIDLKLLLYDAYERGRMIAILPFVCKTLEAMRFSKNFRPPNPWTDRLIKLLAEIHRLPDLKTNLMLEVEVFFRDNNLSIQEHQSDKGQLDKCPKPGPDSPDFNKVAQPTADPHRQSRYSPPGGQVQPGAGRPGGLDYQALMHQHEHQQRKMSPREHPDPQMQQQPHGSGSVGFGSVQGMLPPQQLGADSGAPNYVGGPPGTRQQQQMLYQQTLYQQQQQAAQAGNNMYPGGGPVNTAVAAAAMNLQQHLQAAAGGAQRHQQVASMLGAAATGGGMVEDRPPPSMNFGSVEPMDSHLSSSAGMPSAPAGVDPESLLSKSVAFGETGKGSGQTAKPSALQDDFLLTQAFGPPSAVAAPYPPVAPANLGDQLKLLTHDPPALISPSLALYNIQPQQREAVPVAINSAVIEVMRATLPRSISIAMAATREMIMKDFGDMTGPSAKRTAAWAADFMCATLAGSLNGVTVREPFKAVLVKHLKRGLMQTQSDDTREISRDPDLVLIEQVVQVLAKDNEEIGCSLIEQGVVERAIQEVSSQDFLSSAAKREENASAARWIATLPDFLKPPSGPGPPTDRQLKLYWDFRQQGPLSRLAKKDTTGKVPSNVNPQQTPGASGGQGNPPGTAGGADQLQPQQQVPTAAAQGVANVGAAMGGTSAAARAAALPAAASGGQQQSAAWRRGAQQTSWIPNYYVVVPGTGQIPMNAVISKVDSSFFVIQDSVVRLLSSPPIALPHPGDDLLGGLKYSSPTGASPDCKPFPPAATFALKMLCALPSNAPIFEHIALMRTYVKACAERRKVVEAVAQHACRLLAESVKISLGSSLSLEVGLAMLSSVREADASLTADVCREVTKWILTKWASVDAEVVLGLVRYGLLDKQSANDWIVKQFEENGRQELALEIIYKSLLEFKTMTTGDLGDAISALKKKVAAGVADQKREAANINDDATTGAAAGETKSSSDDNSNDKVENSEGQPPGGEKNESSKADTGAVEGGSEGKQKETYTEEDEEKPAAAGEGKEGKSEPTEERDGGGANDKAADGETEGRDKSKKTTLLMMQKMLLDKIKELEGTEGKEKDVKTDADDGNLAAGNGEAGGQGGETREVDGKNGEAKAEADTDDDDGDEEKEEGKGRNVMSDSGGGAGRKFGKETMGSGSGGGGEEDGGGGMIITLTQLLRRYRRLAPGVIEKKKLLVPVEVQPENRKTFVPILEEWQKAGAWALTPEVSEWAYRQGTSARILDLSDRTGEFFACAIEHAVNASLRPLALRGSAGKATNEGTTSPEATKDRGKAAEEQQEGAHHAAGNGRVPENGGAVEKSEAEENSIPAASSGVTNSTTKEGEDVDNDNGDDDPRNAKNEKVESEEESSPNMAKPGDGKVLPDGAADSKNKQVDGEEKVGAIDSSAEPPPGVSDVCGATVPSSSGDNAKATESSGKGEEDGHEVVGTVVAGENGDGEDALDMGPLDSLVMLLVVLMKKCSTGAAEAGPANQLAVGLMQKFVQVLARSIHRQSEILQDDFNQRPYYRILYVLIHEILPPSPTTAGAAQPPLIVDENSALACIAGALQVLEPTQVPSFAFSSMALISHPTILAKMLTGTPKWTWEAYYRVLVAHFIFLRPFFARSKLDKSILLLHSATLRLCLILLHDFFPFYSAYSQSLTSVLPLNCIQLQNLLLVSPDTKNSTDGAKLPLSNTFSVHVYAPTLVHHGLQEHIDNYVITRDTAELDQILEKMKNSEAVQAITTSKYSSETINAVLSYATQWYYSKVPTASGLSSDGSPLPPTTGEVCFEIVLYLVEKSCYEGKYSILSSLANHVRFTSVEAFKFGKIFVALFAYVEDEATRELITRVAVERLLAEKPHTKGIPTLLIELVKFPAFWRSDFAALSAEGDRLIRTVASHVSRQAQQSSAASTSDSATTTPLSVGGQQPSGPGGVATTTMPVQMSAGVA